MFCNNFSNEVYFIRNEIWIADDEKFRLFLILIFLLLSITSMYNYCYCIYIKDKINIHTITIDSVAFLQYDAKDQIFMHFVIFNFDINIFEKYSDAALSVR